MSLSYRFLLTFIFVVISCFISLSYFLFSLSNSNKEVINSFDVPGVFLLVLSLIFSLLTFSLTIIFLLVLSAIITK